MIYQFNQITLDTAQYRLSLSGNSVAVEPQVFDLLVYLVEHKDRVVTRGELLENLWKGKVVTDSALGARLKDVRKAVGDSGDKQEVIKTIHGRGYQFISEITISETDESHNNNKILSSNEVLPNSEKPSVAVLKFANLSNDSSQQYFSDGMTTNICSRLSRIRSLKVKSAIEYDPAKKSILEISRELDVAYLLSGSVQREGDRARVFAELTDGSTGEIKWSEHFDRLGKEVIDVQDEIATAITGTLWSYQGVIREAELDKISNKPTADFNAFDYILKGIYHKEKFTAEELELARECFDKAIALDPDSTEAYGWRAWVHLLEIDLGSAPDTAESLRQTIVAAKISIAKGSYSEIGHWVLAEAFVRDRDISRGLVEIEKAIEINPNNPDLMLTKGFFLCLQGGFDEGIELIHQAFNFNKHYPEWYFWELGAAYFAGHQLGDAIDSFNRMDNQNKDTLTYLVASYAQTGNLAEAETQLSELLRIDSEISSDQIKDTHSYLAVDTLKLLVDGINLAMRSRKSLEKLRVVQN